MPPLRSVADKIPCWGDGIVGPKECDGVYRCELHLRIGELVKEARAEVWREAAEIARKCHDPWAHPSPYPRLIADELEAKAKEGM